MTIFFRNLSQLNKEDDEENSFSNRFDSFTNLKRLQQQ
jgi:hypothetical protein